MVAGLNNRRSQAGITLLELLVVMAILAFVTTLAAINAPAGRGSAAEEAARLAARMIAAEELALAAGAPLRVEFTASGYAFQRHQGGAWLPAAAPRFEASRVYARDVAVVAEIADPALANEQAQDAQERERERARQTLLIDPLGMGQPYALVFSDRRERWRVSGGAGAPVRVDADGR